MKAILSKISAGYNAVCRKGYVLATGASAKHALSLMLLAGLGLLAFGLADHSLAQSTTFDDTKIRDAAETILTDLIEGSFGALIMIVAGLTAIVAAAMGAYKTAMACLVIAVGAFILRSFVTLFFEF